MKLAKLCIKGFHRHFDTEILFGDATFLIGENNVGKSSILLAIELLLGSKSKLSEEDYFAVLGNGGEIERCSTLELQGEFINIPEEADDWKFFKGLIIDGPNPLQPENTTRKIIIKKTFESGKDVIIQQMSYSLNKKEQFTGCVSIEDYANAGLDLRVDFPAKEASYRLTAKETINIETKYREELYDVETANMDWFTNPGGFFANIACKLPKYIIIPAQNKLADLDSDKGTLQATLQEIFNEICTDSPTYQSALEKLKDFQEEIDPRNPDSFVAQMVNEINTTVSNVFLNSTINVNANLQSDGVIKPKFDISMTSNIETPVANQGTGLIRSAIFSLLRYKNIRDSKKQATGDYVRPLIIGFEEPEIYLHPVAAIKMREEIYKLASSEFNQIVCTTHSPYMIDLSNKEDQVLNKLWLAPKEIPTLLGQCEHDVVCACAFNIEEAYKAIVADEKTYVKMLLKMDESIVKGLFIGKILIVEGDTECVVIEKTLELMPEIKRHMIEFGWEIVRARGKAAIIPLAKYLRAMSINFKVMHDLDYETEGAAIFNAPIVTAVGDANSVYGVENCIEDILGYQPPSKDKPYKSYQHISANWHTYEDVPDRWKNLLEDIFEVKDY